MAEEAPKGKIVISDSEVMTPVAVSTLGFIQVPMFADIAGMSGNVLWVSRHGSTDPDFKWLSFGPGADISLATPYFIKCRFACEIAGLET